MHFIGYHATGANNRSSLMQGLKVVESGWDPKSGGELGPGFYITKDYPSACAYGLGIAMASEAQGVDIWKVNSVYSLDDMDHMAVPTKLQ